MSIINRRVAANIEGDFVVFLIGARINRWWKLPKHMWFAKTMPKMLKELEGRPETGFLGYQQLGPTVNVQYWRSLDQLIAYARSRDESHFPYWVMFNKKIGSSGDVGIWHETYQVRAGEYECIYNCMPPFGLGKVGGHQDATGAHQSAAGRLGKTDGTDAPVSVEGEEVNS
jgi:hypothetical protein